MSTRSFLVENEQLVLLATARATAIGEDTRADVRMLCDPGSQASFITERMAKKLRLFFTPTHTTIRGIGSSGVISRGRVSVVLFSREDHAWSIAVDALVLPTITGTTPSSTLRKQHWPHLSNLHLADPHFGSPGGVDMLLGADVWGDVIVNGIRHGLPREPHAQRTRFGWVVFGSVDAPGQGTKGSLQAVVETEQPSLEELVQRFWIAEESPEEQPSIESEAEQIFSSTTTRTPDGRYQVCIPFQRHAPHLGDSFIVARNVMRRMERRFAHDVNLRDKYVQFMKEYEDLGHMERVSPPLHSGNCNYIPHHAVLGKFRVVFNASARTSTGVSLNDTQLVGPTVQPSLLHILLRFRRYPVAITADVEKMFRQINVAEEHRDWQRILWRSSPDEELQVFRLSTVTYGMASSPFLAVRALNQCAIDNCSAAGELGDEARKTILSSFYVDDFLHSCVDENSAVCLGAAVEKVLSSGQFHLRKWNSNSARVVQHFSPIQQPALEIVIDDNATSVLGLRWDPTSDEFFFRVPPAPTMSVMTKRSTLREVAKLFDPTGLVAPVVVAGKIFVQQLWLAELGWDDPLPPELSARWFRLRTSLVRLNDLRISRWVGMQRDAPIALHGFCDASAKAYAAVIYVQSQDESGEVRLSLLTARTKVAPIKGSTIPRLELCAAALLAATIAKVRDALQLQDVTCHLWSDAQVVLHWLCKSPADLKPYVANRVRLVQECTTREQWHYLRTEENPADCASRGITAPELLQHPLWWSGPPRAVWMSPAAMIPESPPTEDLESVLQEGRVVVAAVVVTSHRIQIGTSRGPVPLVERWSSIRTLLHVLARALRWAATRRHLRSNKVVDPDELNAARRILVREAQHVAFPREVSALCRKTSIPPSSALLPLNPFLDDVGLLRVGGRLSGAVLPPDRRFPMILPKSDPLSTLVVRSIHLETEHGGTQLMLHTLRREYWMIHARQAIRSYIHRCVICRRVQGTLIQQQMAPLPAMRITPQRPFSSSGVDYCGPFHLRLGTRGAKSTVKTYLSIFVCVATKAVHIEVVENLTARAFLDAFTRFVSRRGQCRHLYSDNGTAFHGADRLMKEDVQQWESDHNQQHLADCGTQWHFITPNAPHQGGLWEAAVKSTKHHLVRLVGAHPIRREHMLTLVARIEACLNSRPLVALTDDPGDKLALCPADFLIGEPIFAVSEPNTESADVTPARHWAWLRHNHQQFWQRWSDEYLSSLQTRSKWQRAQPDLQVGDVVAIKGENLPPTHWRLGRVSDLHPGPDGRVRNVTVQTATGALTRAVQKLSRLVEATTTT